MDWQVVHKKEKAKEGKAEAAPAANGNQPSNSNPQRKPQSNKPKGERRSQNNSQSTGHANSAKPADKPATKEPAPSNGIIKEWGKISTTTTASCGLSFLEIARQKSQPKPQPNTTPKPEPVSEPAVVSAAPEVEVTSNKWDTFEEATTVAIPEPAPVVEEPVAAAKSWGSFESSPAPAAAAPAPAAVSAPAPVAAPAPVTPPTEITFPEKKTLATAPVVSVPKPAEKTAAAPPTAVEAPATTSQYGKSPEPLYTRGQQIEKAASTSIVPTYLQSLISTDFVFKAPDAEPEVDVNISSSLPSTLPTPTPSDPIFASPPPSFASPKDSALDHTHRPLHGFQTNTSSWGTHRSNYNAPQNYYPQSDFTKKSSPPNPINANNNTQQDFNPLMGMYGNVYGNYPLMQQNDNEYWKGFSNNTYNFNYSSPGMNNYYPNPSYGYSGNNNYAKPYYARGGRGGGKLNSPGGHKGRGRGSFSNNLGGTSAPAGSAPHTAHAPFNPSITHSLGQGNDLSYHTPFSNFSSQSTGAAPGRQFPPNANTWFTGV